MLKATHQLPPSFIGINSGEELLLDNSFLPGLVKNWFFLRSPGAGGYYLSFFIFFFFFITTNIAQVKDTALSPKKLEITNPNKHADSLAQIKTQPKTIPAYHSPKRAALMSTIIPGSGQIYNKKYWKVPVIYAGLAGLAYSINFNQTRYIKYRTAFKYRIDDDPLTIADSPYSNADLDLLQQYYHRYRNLSVIGATLLYVMNIIDASVDAHMFTFDVSDDLSFNIHPALINTANVNHYATGFSLNIKF